MPSLTALLDGPRLRVFLSSTRTSFRDWSNTQYAFSVGHGNPKRSCWTMNLSRLYLFSPASLAVLALVGCTAKSTSSSDGSLGVSESALQGDNSDSHDAEDATEDGIENGLSGATAADPGTPATLPRSTRRSKRTQANTSPLLAVSSARRFRLACGTTSSLDAAGAEARPFTTVRLSRHGPRRRDRRPSNTMPPTLS